MVMVWCLSGTPLPEVLQSTPRVRNDIGSDHGLIISGFSSVSEHGKNNNFNSRKV